MYWIVRDNGPRGREYWNGTIWVDDPSGCEHGQLSLAQDERKRAGFNAFITESPEGPPAQAGYGGGKTLEF